MSSLAKQRRDFIFSAVSAFAPVKREEIRGAGALLTIFDEVIERIKNFKFFLDVVISISKETKEKIILYVTDLKFKIKRIYLKK